MATQSSAATARDLDRESELHYDPHAYNAVIRAAPGDVDASIAPRAIRGRIPPELRGGTYLLNGPGLVELGGRLMHPFDGHGYVRAIRLTDEGGAAMRARFVDTMAYRIESQEQALRFRGIGTLVAEPSLLGGGFLDNLRAPLGKNVANTAVHAWAGRILALWEGGLPHALDPGSLRTRGEESFAGAIAAPFLAHTRVDRPRGRLCGLSARPGARSTALTFTELDVHGQLVARSERTLPEFTILHDFAITRSYYVVFAAAMRPDLGRFLRVKLGLGAMIGAIDLDRPRPSTIYFFPRDGVGPAIVAPLDRTWMSVHHAGAHEVADEDGAATAVILDTCLFDHFEFGREFGYQGTTRPLDPRCSPAVTQQLSRVTVDLRDRRAEVVPLSPWSIDFPRIHPDRDGQRCRFVYGATVAVPGRRFPFDALIRVDVDAALAGDEAASTIWSPGGGRLCGEPVFAPRPGARAEDDGWVIAMIYDGAAGESTLVILDAAELAAGPVAEVPMGCLLPYGFHGSWEPTL